MPSPRARWYRLLCRRCRLPFFPHICCLAQGVQRPYPWAASPILAAPFLRAWKITFAQRGDRHQPRANNQ